MSDDKPNGADVERTRVHDAEMKIAEDILAVISDHISTRRGILTTRRVIEYGWRTDRVKPLALIGLDDAFQLAASVLLDQSCSELAHELRMIDEYRARVMRPRDSDGNVITAEDSGPGAD